MDIGDDEPDASDALVAFFRRLSSAARREYGALAERDLAFGEDVAAERRRASRAAPEEA